MHRVVVRVDKLIRGGVGGLTSWHGGGVERVDELIQRVDAWSRGEGGRADTGSVLRVLDELRSAITRQGMKGQGAAHWVRVVTDYGTACNVAGEG